MRRHAVLTAALLLSLLTVSAQAANEEASPKYRAESSAYRIEGGDAWTYVTENRSFRFEEVLGDGGDYEAVILLEQTYHNERTPGLWRAQEGR